MSDYHIRTYPANGTSQNFNYSQQAVNGTVMYYCVGQRFMLYYTTSGWQELNVVR